jgi:hypothetical protein
MSPEDDSAESFAKSSAESLAPSLRYGLREWQTTISLFTLLFPL